MTDRRALVAVVCLFLIWGGADAQEVDFRGQAAASFVSSDADARQLRADFRYQPDLTVSVPVGASSDLTGFVAGEFLYSSRIWSLDDACLLYTSDAADDYLTV